jgi:hypothetical protein
VLTRGHLLQREGDKPFITVYTFDDKAIRSDERREEEGSEGKERPIGIIFINQLNVASNSIERNHEESLKNINEDLPPVL